jgi:hypothetical protein
MTHMRKPDPDELDSQFQQPTTFGIPLKPFSVLSPYILYSVVETSTGVNHFPDQEQGN